jgi:uncharacterized membrane protein YsdA (DUF1294 family)
MSRRFRYQIVFGLLAALAFSALYLVFQYTTSWAWYWCQVVAASIVAFVFYAVDKGLAKAHTGRVPEVILHLLALMGGFGGALLGMLVFRHKSNFRAHPLFLPVIFVSAVIWGFLIYQVTR